MHPPFLPPACTHHCAPVVQAYAKARALGLQHFSVEHGVEAALASHKRGADRVKAAPKPAAPKPAAAEGGAAAAWKRAAVVSGSPKAKAAAAVVKKAQEAVQKKKAAAAALAAVAAVAGKKRTRPTEAAGEAHVAKAIKA